MEEMGLKNVPNVNFLIIAAFIALLLRKKKHKSDTKFKPSPVSRSFSRSPIRRSKFKTPTKRNIRKKVKTLGGVA